MPRLSNELSLYDNIIANRIKSDELSDAKVASLVITITEASRS